MRYQTIALAAACLVSFGCGPSAGDGIDSSAFHESGVKVLENFHGAPDAHGVMAEFPVALPEFDRAVYYVSEWWPGGGNRVFPVVYT